jgi:holo-[acyl-carrier protein] synthase
MAQRVGIDLVDVEAVRDSIARHAQRYLDRVYTDREIGDCRTAGGISAERLAQRFAAKEASLKALRAGDHAVPWQAIEVAGAAGGPQLVLSGAARMLADEAGLHDWRLSLACASGYASAIVLVQGTP